MNNEVLLELRNIKKVFPGVVALDDVDFILKKGTVHALMGENGAGKSTLMKILMGIYSPDGGEIVYKGDECKIHNSRDALNLGISMIHQELNNIKEMTVAENIFLMREPVNKITRLVSFKKMCEDTENLFKKLNISGISSKTKIKNLSIAECQMVEIAKAVSYDSDVIIMDEPTSAISENEVENLFKIISKLKSEGRSIIYISHKMDEIFKISDYITVLCDGKFIGTDAAENLDRQKLIKMMVGRELTELFYKNDVETGDIALEIKNLSKEGLFSNINFNVRRGEILGIAGLMGAGRTELVETICGMRGIYHGEIYKDGELLDIKKQKDAIENGIVLATEDRRRYGLVLGLPIKDNISLPSLQNFSKFEMVNVDEENKKVDDLIDKVGIKAPSSRTHASKLSGGNQQKVVLAKWLLVNPDVLILDEPTRGIDVGAKIEIYKIMSKLVASGVAIIMISSEMPEVISLSDRIIVMHDGRITGEIAKNEVSQEKIMGLIAD